MSTSRRERFGFTTNCKKIDRKLTLVPPKTAKSRRTLVMPPLIVDRLREHEQRQVAEKIWAGSKWEEAGLLFANRTGGSTQARHVIEQFHQALELGGMRRIRFHDLGHSCATLLLVQGVSPRVVMEVLGHSEIALTMNAYSRRTGLGTTGFVSSDHRRYYT